MRRWIASLLGLALANSALAGQTAALPGQGIFTLQGFGTLGGPFYSSTDQATFIRDRSQPDGARGHGLALEVDSRLGVQANWRPSEQLEAVVQLVGKYRYDGTYRPQVPWAFVKLALPPDVQIRAGRLGYDAYLLSDSRDVGYSYLWVRPPVDYFGQIHWTHFDGVDLTAQHGLGNGFLKGKLFVGQLNESAVSPDGIDYKMQGSWLWGGHLDFQNPNWQVRAGLGVLRLENDYPPFLLLQDGLRATGVPAAAVLADEISAAHKDFRYLSLGVVYDAGALQSQIQIRRLDVDTESYADNTAGYWSLGYRLGRWTPYLVYSRIKSEHRQPATGLPPISPYTVLDAAVSRIFASTQADQDTLSVGTRFDFAQNAALKLQVDWIRSRDNPSLLWLDADPDWGGRATILSATLDFVF